MLSWFVAGLIGCVILSTFLSVNTFPVLTNDSLAYLGHSADFGTYGFVNVGYRQLGYPLALAAFRTVADLLTVEPLLFVSIAQGVLLLTAVVLSAILWRWIGVGLMAFLLGASTLAYPNLVLTEGLSLPLAVLLAIAFVGITSKLDEWEHEHRWRLWALAAVAVGLSVALVAIRYPFAVFGLIPLGVVWAAWKTSFRKPALLLLAGYLIVASSLSVALSAENANEYGVFFPTVRGERSAYWATWSVVFTLDPGAAEDPELAPFYDDGDPYVFIGEVDNSGLGYPEQRLLYNEAIDELIAAAGMSPMGSRFESFVWALRGGRLDDLAGITDRIASSSRHNVDQVIHSNRFSREEGIEAFSDRFNRGQLPEAVLTSEAGLRLPLPDSQASVSLLLPLALFVLLIGVTKRETRVESVAGLLVVVAYAAAIGAVRADNYRFLITTSGFALVMGTGVGYHLLLLWKNRRRTTHSSEASTRADRVSERSEGSTET